MEFRIKRKSFALLLFIDRMFAVPGTNKAEHIHFISVWCAIYRFNSISNLMQATISFHIENVVPFDEEKCFVFESKNKKQKNYDLWLRCSFIKIFQLTTHSEGINMMTVAEDIWKNFFVSVFVISSSSLICLFRCSNKNKRNRALIWCWA